MTKKERDEIIAELKEQYPIEEQTTFNEFNLNDKLQENTKLYRQYKELYEHELFVYRQLEEKMDILKGKQYDFYRFESDRNLQKSEVEQYYLPRDKKILKMKDMLQKQQTRVNFFKLCMDSIDKLYWRMKAFMQGDTLGY